MPTLPSTHIPSYTFQAMFNSNNSQWSSNGAIPPLPAAPLTAYPTDGESDSVSTLMLSGRNYKKGGKGQNGRNGKSRLRVEKSDIEDRSIDNRSQAPSPSPSPSGAVTPEPTAFPAKVYHTAITSKTGFSPLNPTASLSDSFSKVGRTPAAVEPIESAYPSRKVDIPPVRPPTPKATKASFDSPILSSIPPTPVVKLPSYRELRPQLFQDAFFQSVNGARFDDTQIHVFSARTSSGVAHKPRVLHARSAFLEAASTQFEEEIYKSCSVKSKAAVKRSCSRFDYGYDDDSDLEDLEEEPEVNVVNDLSGMLSGTTIASGKTVAGSRTVARRPDIDPPKSSVSTSDGELMSIDGSEDDFSDFTVEEKSVEEPRTAICTPSRPILTLQTTSFDAKEQYIPFDIKEEYKTPEMPTLPLDDFRKEDRSSPLPVLEPLTPAPQLTAVVHKVEASIEADISESDRILFIPDSAHKTWQALLLYLYNDYLSFASLRSENMPAHPESKSRPQCSPKSMYRLADKLGLKDLKRSAFEAIEKRLSKDNIVTELFSDFTWRYPEMLQMETEVFYRYSSERVVQIAMSEIFQDIAYGQLPHSSVVLDSIFKKFAAACMPIPTTKP